MARQCSRSILQAHACNVLLHASYASRSSISQLCHGPIGRDIQDRESEVPRIPIPRTPLNKGIRKGQGCFELRPSATFAYHYYFFFSFFCTFVGLTSPW